MIRAEERQRKRPARVCEMKRTTHLNMRNYTGWRCASCHRLITSVNDGWVEWLASENDDGGETVSALRLVHRESCRYDVHTVFGNGEVWQKACVSSASWDPMV